MANQELAVIPQQSVVQAEDHGGLLMHCSPAEALRRLQELQAFVKEAMVKDVDYGVIQGTDKPTLFQPGAQKLCEIYSLTAEYEDLDAVQDWERPFFYYRKRCVLKRRGGGFAGMGIGSCNSREDRYAWRWVYDNQLPKGVDVSTLKAKEYNGRNGSTYTKFRLPNEDIYSLVNTIEKMSCKRSLIHAVLGVTRTSNLFHQDLEDIPSDAIGVADEERSWEKGTPTKVVLDMSPAGEPAAKVPTAREKLAQQAERLCKAAEEAKTQEQFDAIRIEGGKMPAGPERTKVVEVFTFFWEKARAAAAARKAQETATKGEEQKPKSADDSGPCSWVDEKTGECCTGEGLPRGLRGYRCKKHDAVAQ